MQTAIRISRRAADRLRGGYLWVYRSDVQATEQDLQAAPAGALVTVQDAAGRPLGTAMFSAASQIALRVVARTPELARERYLEDVGQRVAEALALRRVVAPLATEPATATTAQRLIFSEADGLPGMIADRYGELVIVQLLTQGTAQDDVRQALAQALQTALSPAGEPLTIWERTDPRIRELEQLPPAPEAPLFTNAGGASETVVRLNGLRYHYDAVAGQKTGAFLDQRLNYQAAAEWVRRSGRTGHALDVCTYQGGFALHLARVCERVTGVDQSRSALEMADRNLELNREACGTVDWVEADAFAFLRALDDAARSGSRRGLPGGLPAQFDAIVLDPPAFTKTRRATEGALRGYKELNLRAMRLLAPGGVLVTCSCSHHVALESFTATVAEAAADAGRRVQLLEVRAAAPDHPEVLTLPETRYLKALICRVN